jgi:hypothetical protein
MNEKYEPMKIEELTDILSLTIKEDEENKVASFLCQLSAFTEDSQFNVLFNAPSSSGKSYIPLEIANLFPKDDVIKIGNCSPTAFFHEQGSYDKVTNTTTVDLARKILIFLDMPHTGLLEKLRSFLSHDEKEMISKITDKGQKGGHKTKTVVLKGYPSVIFCSAGFNIDEQELTRFLVLSPEATQEKIEQGINQAIRKAVSPEEYEGFINSDPRRKLLKERILDIKRSHIGDIRISSEELVRELFLANTKGLKPRHQRDIKRFMSLIKSIALLNHWWREQTMTGIIANEEDIREAFKIWEKISVSQEMNLSPYIFNIYKDIIKPLWKEKAEAKKKDEFEFNKECGITRKEVLQKYFDVYRRPLDIYKLRMDVLRSLETAGLITQEQDQNNRRNMLILPAIDTDEHGVDEGGVIEDSFF